MTSTEFSAMLAIAHERLVMLDDLKQTNESILFLRGVSVGVFGTLFSLAVYFWGWRILCALF